MNRINNKFKAAVKQYNMLTSGDRVVVALSGGADSVALLLLLKELRSEISFELTAAHLNHGIRGAEANRDEEFCKKLCRDNEIALSVSHADIPAISSETGESTELCARRIRYDFLNECAGSGKIATAHTLTDNAETVLLNLIRGSGIKGLTGIPPVRDNIIRPLINVGGGEIRDYLRNIGQEYVIDSTNLSDEYSRNRIRLNCLPQLRLINENADENISRGGELLRIDEDYLSREAHSALESAQRGGMLDCKTLYDLHDAVLSRVVREFCRRVTGHTPDALHTSEMVGLIRRRSGRTSIPGGYTAGIIKSLFYIDTEETGGTLSERRQVLLKLCNKSKVNNLLLKNTLDYDRIGDNLIIRNRMDGDSFTPAGRGITKSLKKLFNEAGVPPCKRNDIIILADDEGIVWVEGFGVAERCRPDESTENLLVIEYNDKQK